MQLRQVYKMSTEINSLLDFSPNSNYMRTIHCMLGNILFPSNFKNPSEI